MAERVSVIIPNWNGWSLLDRCLDSLRGQTYRDFRSYVVDNGSSDGSVERTRERFPEVALIPLDRNTGFATAVNQGIAGSNGEYIVLLNNDTVADPEWLSRLVAALDERPDVAFAASLLVCDDDPSVVDSLGDGYTLMGLSFKVADRQRNTGQFQRPFETFSACAAAAIYRRSLFDRIGVFDDDFFMYMEDIDIGLRARLAGHRCLAVPSAIVRHVGSASTGGDTSALSIRMTAKNLIFILAKDIPLPALCVMLPSAIAAQIALLTLCLCTDRYPGLRRHLRAYGKGIVAGLRGVPLMLTKRRQVQATRRIGTWTLLRMIRLSESQRRARAPARPGWPPPALDMVETRAL